MTAVPSIQTATLADCQALPMMGAAAPPVASAEVRADGIVTAPRQAKEGSGMRVSVFHVEAFTSRRYGGNPAAVLVLDKLPDDGVLRSVASELNLSATAFLVPHGEQYTIRWFTPSAELPLCGHATMASAAVVLDKLQPHRATTCFCSRAGPLEVRRVDGGFELDLPARVAKPVAASPPLSWALGAVPNKVLINEHDYLAVFDDPVAVRGLTPDSHLIASLERMGVIVTAPGDGGNDFISRYFAPRKGIPEDPVTGSAHCTLIPYWSERTGKRLLKAHQASSRGGDIVCEWLDSDWVRMRGDCIHFSEGTATI